MFDENSEIYIYIYISDWQRDNRIHAFQSYPNFFLSEEVIFSLLSCLLILKGMAFTYTSIISILILFLYWTCWSTGSLFIDPSGGMTFTYSSSIFILIIYLYCTYWSTATLFIKFIFTFCVGRTISSYVTNVLYREISNMVLLVEQELLTLPKHMSSPPVFKWVRVTRSSVLCLCFVDRCLCFCTFSFGHCVFCLSSIYGFWLPLWYLHTSSSVLCTIEWTESKYGCCFSLL